MRTRTTLLSLLILLTLSCTRNDDPNPYVAIPDINFEKALIDRGIDDVQDGKLLISSAQKVTFLDVSNRDITNLQGVEAFIFLTFLNCTYNSLTSLSLKSSANLTYLSCAFNRLTTLDISRNPALTGLVCQNNNLASLDISKNVALLDLYCSQNSLTSLDVSQNNALVHLDCRSNKLTDLTVAKNPAITHLDCSGNNIRNVCVSSLLQVTAFWKKDDSATYQVCK